MNKRIFPPEFYKLNFFLENDFKRKECPICKEFYWTIKEDQETCNEAPCVPYSFIGNPPSFKKFSLKETREKFLNFFKKKGHEIINPYPVVARWRTDLFLTDASIVDFQPFVTNGISPPPANPLVISQPCIRLVDIDKVGLTFGRHLTIFEMGGHHAFNYPDKNIYWKEETVQYCQEFIKEEFGINPENVTYKEGIWSGGGNAGPCFEVIIGGLEVATLVFMQYKTIDTELIELPIRTVDTGYGMERFSWLSNGSYSCFNVIYGEIYPLISRIIDIPKIEEEILNKYAAYSAIMASRESISKLREEISRKTGIPIEIINNDIPLLEKIYAALDYTKSIVFIISEGVVPSNAKVGYLARLLIRRAYNTLSEINCEDKLLDLIEFQIDYWSKDFPHLLDSKNETLEIIEAEIKKFEETIKKGREFLKREISNISKKGIKHIPKDLLIRFYDEKGLTPNIVKQIASEFDIALDIPENFYEEVASKHLRSIIKIEEDKITRLKDKVSGFQSTEKLYYKNPFQKSFEAKVLGIIEDAIILDKTLFYPESGGQMYDSGIIISSKGISKVKDVQIIDDVILHFLDGPIPDIGEKISGEIDIDRRIALMRHHSATHILMGAAMRVLGKHVWQAGAKKEPEKARLDISHHKRLSLEEIHKIEKLANEIIAKRIPIKIQLMNRNKAEKEYGFRLYQGGEVPLGEIRVVEIPGWDAQACGGLHCENTEDVGLIKIIKTERIQDGVERIIFSAGSAALKYIQEIEKNIFDISNNIKTPIEEINKKVYEIFTDLKDSKKTIKKLYEKIVKLKVNELLNKAFKFEDVLIIKSYEEIDDQEYLLQLASNLTFSKEARIAILLAGEEKVRIIVLANEEALNKGYDASNICRKIAIELGGSGGGKKDLGQGGAPYSIDKINSVLKKLESNPKFFLEKNE